MKEAKVKIQEEAGKNKVVMMTMMIHWEFKHREGMGYTPHISHTPARTLSPII